MSNLPTVKTIALDWLELNCIQPGKQLDAVFISTYFEENQESKRINIPGSEYFFEIIPEPDRRTRVFSKCHKIMYAGHELGHVFSAPYNYAIKPANSMSFKVHNSWLYSDWYTPVKLFCDSLAIKFENLKRCDIACDGENFTAPIQDVKLEKIHHVGNCTIDLKIRGGEGVHSFRIGSPKSNKYIRCYNKYKEIEEHSKKHYIYDFWKANGIEPDQFEKMQRLEVSMNCREINRLVTWWNWDSLKLFTQVEFLVSMAKTGFDSLYTFKYKTNSNITRARKCYSLRWFAKGNPIQKMVHRTAKKIRAMQTTIRTTYQLFLKTQQQHFKLMADELIYNCQLETWFDKRRKGFEYEYELSVKYEKPFLPLYDDLTRYLSNKFSPIIPKSNRRGYVTI